jgi:hypothetical protein
MTLDLATTATIAGIAGTAAGGVGWVIHALVTPKIQGAVKEHEGACQVRAALTTEANALARALAAEASSLAKALEVEAKLRENGDARLEHTMERLGERIDNGFEGLNATLLRMASGVKI